MKRIMNIISYILILGTVVSLFFIIITLLPRFLARNFINQTAVNKTETISSQDSYPPPNFPTSTSTAIYTLEPPYPAPINTESTFGGDPTPTFPSEYFITPTVPTVGDDGWYIYTDPDLGYSFHYPIESHLTASRGPRSPYNTLTLQVQVPKAHNYYGLVVIVRDNKEGLSVDKFAVNLYQELSKSETIPMDFLAKAETISLSDFTGLRVDIPQTNAYFTLLVPYKDKMMEILVAGNPLGGEDSGKEEFLSIVEKILSTIKFNK